jgi:hypothetical protein
LQLGFQEAFTKLSGSARILYWLKKEVQRDYARIIAQEGFNYFSDNIIYKIYNTEYDPRKCVRIYLKLDVLFITNSYIITSM